MNCTVYSLFQFSYLHTFYRPNNITTNLIFKVSQRKRLIDIPLWTHMRRKEWRESGKHLQGVTPLFKNFYMNLMAILFSYISQVIGQKKWHLYLKMLRKKQWDSALRHQNIKKHIALVNNFWTLSEWIRNMQMIHFSTIKTRMRMLHG